MSYRVVVTREDDAWLADIPGVQGAHTYSRDLTKLDLYVREVVSLMEDMPEEAMPGLDLEWVFETGDPDVDTRAAALRAERDVVNATVADLAERTRVAAVGLAAKGYSVRDIAGLLGISPQRVSQIAPKAPRKPGAPTVRGRVAAAVRRA
jgi:DNA-directed RNA polymerase specialized sigma24 family protein